MMPPGSDDGPAGDRIGLGFGIGLGDGLWAGQTNPLDTPTKTSLP
jgi:hypothetical protein